MAICHVARKGMFWEYHIAVSQPRDRGALCGVLRLLEQVRPKYKHMAEAVLAQTDTDKFHTQK